MGTTRLVPADAALPFLAVALDAQAMRGVFEQHLRARPGNGMVVIACEIDRVKYRPQRNCIIGYKLRLCDAGAEHEQRLCVGIYEPDDAAARYKKALLDTNVATVGFAPVTAIRPLNMVVWAFPNERKLNALPHISDTAQLRENLLPEVVRARWGDGWDIAELSSTISNYFPEHCCCVSVTLTLIHVENGARRTWEIIGKTRYDDGGAQTYRHMNALWPNSGKAVAYARPIVYQSEQRLLWQERVPGVTLHSLLVSGAAGMGLLVRVARALAALQSTTVALANPVALPDLIEQLTSAKKIVAAAHPDCAAALHQMVGALIENAGRLNANYEATWHGDLHSKNILVSAAQIHFIDMDRVAVGPPLAELGSFLAELIYRGCLAGESLVAVQPTLTRVVAAYRQGVSWPAPENDVAWFTASALIHERALRCVTSLKPGRINSVGALIAVAKHIAEGGLFAPCTAPTTGALRELDQVA